MHWEDLTIANFEEAVARAGGVCILPMGVIEAHGPHNPLSTDLLRAYRVASAASELEPAIVFPAYPWGVNVETKAWPGGIVIKRRILFDLLENVCAEISRNGCKKILLFNGHGGNGRFLRFFVQTRLEQEVDYVPYLIDGGAMGRDEFYDEVFETAGDHHGCEGETSLMMYLAPEATHPEWIPEEPGEPLHRADHLLGRFLTPADWYARYPDHYAGDARPASAEKGKIWFEHRVSFLVVVIRRIKEDETAYAVYREYVGRTYRR